MLTNEQAGLLTFEGFVKRYRLYVSQGNAESRAYELTERDQSAVSQQRRYGDFVEFERLLKRIGK
ncbi:hypothetical protein GCM10027299_28940 [Larkinella ripae]